MFHNDLLSLSMSVDDKKRFWFSLCCLFASLIVCHRLHKRQHTFYCGDFAECISVWFSCAIRDLFVFAILIQFLHHVKKIRCFFIKTYKTYKFLFNTLKIRLSCQ